MINISAKKSLGLTQSDIKMNGWSVEASIYAEDPIRNFAPSIGLLKTFKSPNENSSSIRLDFLVFKKVARFQCIMIQ